MPSRWHQSTYSCAGEGDNSCCSESGGLQRKLGGEALHRAFSPSRKGARPGLRLSVYSRRLDFHQKTLLSDDLGVAVACYVMETFFPVAEIANATTAVESRTQGATEPERNGRTWCAPTLREIARTLSNAKEVEAGGPRSAAN